MALSMLVRPINPNTTSVIQSNLKFQVNFNDFPVYLSSIDRSTVKTTKLLFSALPNLRRRASLNLQRLMASASPSATDEVLKLATFVIGEEETQVGVVRHGYIWPLKQVLNSSQNISAAHISEMSDVISHWHLLYNCIKFEGPGIKLENVKLLAPIPKPHGAIICIGKNYADHVKEVDTWKTAPDITSPSIPKYPIVFTKAPQSVIGPGAAIVYPQAITTQVDYETELAVIIGKSGHCIKREDAISHVFGYTILNDVTARDLQKKHQQWFMGKSCDTFCPMGPWIVPATEINGEDLQIQCWVNGELRQNGRTSDMIFSIPELIETISSGITLQPGDIIATGTPSGVGSGFNPPRHLVPGDSICMKIEGIGELNNHII
ncbi:uncharacterized protein LOC131068486 [Cryptomeria japonica]|uniref:uncharacterized protein LOC131068486 n=1 Tax=Cryptomeria japonica TaxID=3369 RepID=UPI0027DA03E6|nr:uncharacterized protein LOC131068486 [Cryptomeria japonica]